MTRLYQKNDIYFKVFTICLLVSSVIFIPLTIKGSGMLTFSEDFNSYVLPYRYLENRAVHSGELFWNWNIDLGSSFLGDFCQVSIFWNPFNWIYLFLPESTIPYSVLPIMLLKFSVAGLNMSVYLKRFFRDNTTIIIGSVLYAFSGFHACLLVFDFLGDSSIFFPLLMWSLEKLIQENKRGIFAFWCFYVCTLSLSQFFGIIIFSVVYFILKYGRPIKEGIRNLCRVLVEGIVAALMSAVVTYPSIINILGIPKQASKLAGAYWLTFDSTTVMQLIKGLILPADTMTWGSAIYSNDWATTALYLPGIGLSIVFAFLISTRKKDKDWKWYLLFWIVLSVFIPVINNLYYAESSTPYHRWYYIAEFVMAFISCDMIEHTDSINAKTIRKGFYASFLLIFCFTLIVYLVPWYDTGEKISIFGHRRFIFSILIAVVFLVVCLLVFVSYNPSRDNKKLMWIIVCAAIVSTYSTAWQYKGVSANPTSDSKNPLTMNATPTVYNELINTTRPMVKNRIGAFPARTCFWRGYYNYSMMSSIPSRNTFIGNLNSSIYKFYHALGADRLTSFTPEGPLGTNELVGTKYYLLTTPDVGMKQLMHYSNGNRELYLFDDEEALSLGYTYDTYITYSEFKALPTDVRGEAMLKALVIPDKKESIVSGILTKDSEDFGTKADSNKVNAAKIAHLNECGSNYKKTARTFSCDINADNEKYMFFSCPYDVRWTALVNGKKAEIINVNGFMAVRIGRGSNHIKFIWTPKYIIKGGIISLMGLFLLLIYLLLHKKANQKER